MNDYLVSHGAEYMSRQDYVGEIGKARKADHLFDMSAVTDASYHFFFVHVASPKLFKAMAFAMMHVPHTVDEPFDSKEHIAMCDLTWDDILAYREHVGAKDDEQITVDIKLILCGDGVRVKRNKHGEGNSLVAWTIRPLNVKLGISMCVWGRAGFAHRFQTRQHWGFET